MAVNNDYFFFDKTYYDYLAQAKGRTTEVAKRTSSSVSANINSLIKSFSGKDIPINEMARLNRLVKRWVEDIYGNEDVFKLSLAESTFPKVLDFVFKFPNTSLNVESYSVYEYYTMYPFAEVFFNTESSRAKVDVGLLYLLGGITVHFFNQDSLDIFDILDDYAVNLVPSFSEGFYLSELPGSKRLIYDVADKVTNFNKLNIVYPDTEKCRGMIFSEMEIQL